MLTDQDRAEEILCELRSGTINEVTLREIPGSLQLDETIAVLYGDPWSGFLERWVRFVAVSKADPAAVNLLLDCVVLAIEGGNPHLVHTLLAQNEAVCILQSAEPLNRLRLRSLEAKALRNMGRYQEANYRFEDVISGAKDQKLPGFAAFAKVLQAKMFGKYLGEGWRYREILTEALERLTRLLGHHARTSESIADVRRYAAICFDTEASFLAEHSVDPTDLSRARRLLARALEINTLPESFNPAGAARNRCHSIRLLADRPSEGEIRQAYREFKSGQRMLETLPRAFHLRGVIIRRAQEAEFLWHHAEQIGLDSRLRCSLPSKLVHMVQNNRSLRNWRQVTSGLLGLDEIYTDDPAARRKFLEECVEVARQYNLRIPLTRALDRLFQIAGSDRNFETYLESVRSRWAVLDENAEIIKGDVAALHTLRPRRNLPLPVLRGLASDLLDVLDAKSEMAKDAFERLSILHSRSVEAENRRNLAIAMALNQIVTERSVSRLENSIRRLSRNRDLGIRLNTALEAHGAMYGSDATLNALRTSLDELPDIVDEMAAAVNALRLPKIDESGDWYDLARMVGHVWDEIARERHLEAVTYEGGPVLQVRLPIYILQIWLRNLLASIVEWFQPRQIVIATTAHEPGFSLVLTLLPKASASMLQPQRWKSADTLLSALDGHTEVSFDTNSATIRFVFSHTHTALRSQPTERS